MNAENASTMPKQKTKRRFHPVLNVVIILAFTAGIVALSALTSRPHWRTLTEPVIAGSRVVAVDCPDDWVLTDHGQLAGGPGRYLVLQRREPTGLMRWWNEHASPVHNHPTTRTRIMIALYLGSGLKKTGMKMDSLQVVTLL